MKEIYQSGEFWVPQLKHNTSAWEFIATGEIRPPKKGEWYLAGGGIKRAFYARIDLEYPHYIVKHRIP